MLTVAHITVKMSDVLSFDTENKKGSWILFVRARAFDFYWFHVSNLEFKSSQSMLSECTFEMWKKFLSENNEKQISLLINNFR